MRRECGIEFGQLRWRADCCGCASAIVRRSTTATEITMHAQNPMRSERQEGCVSCKIAFLPTPEVVFTTLLLEIDILRLHWIVEFPGCTPTISIPELLAWLTCCS